MAIGKKPDAKSAGRVAKAQRDQGAANEKIRSKLATQSYVQGMRGGQTADAKAQGMRPAVPSPAYWDGSKRKPSKAEKTANTAFAGYKHLAKKGK
jgi:hypothetical protein